MVQSNKKFCLKADGEAREMFCFERLSKCEGRNCATWVDVDGSIGYCCLIDSMLRNKEFELDNVDRKTLLTREKAISEYDFCDWLDECKTDKCVGWIDYGGGLGCCVKDHLIGEKYQTTVVEGATNFLKIKRVWDNSFKSILLLMKDITERIESDFNSEEISYVITLSIRDIFRELSKDKDKGELFYFLKNVARFDGNGDVVKVDDDFLDFVFWVMTMGAAMNRFLVVQDIAEIMAE